MKPGSDQSHTTLPWAYSVGLPAHKLHTSHHTAIIKTCDEVCEVHKHMYACSNTHMLWWKHTLCTHSLQWRHSRTSVVCPGSHVPLGGADPFSTESMRYNWLYYIVAKRRVSYRNVCWCVCFREREGGRKSYMYKHLCAFLSVYTVCVYHMYAFGIFPSIIIDVVVDAECVCVYPLKIAQTLCCYYMKFF